MRVKVPASVERRGTAAAVNAAERLADAVREQVPGVSVSCEGMEMAVTGRGVLSDALLRWPAGLLR